MARRWRGETYPTVPFDGFGGHLFSFHMIHQLISQLFKHGLKVEPSLLLDVCRRHRRQSERMRVRVRSNESNPALSIFGYLCYRRRRVVSACVLVLVSRDPIITARSRLAQIGGGARSSAMRIDNEHHRLMVDDKMLCKYYQHCCHLFSPTFDS